MYPSTQPDDAAQHCAISSRCDVSYLSRSHTRGEMRCIFALSATSQLSQRHRCLIHFIQRHGTNAASEFRFPQPSLTPRSTGMPTKRTVSTDGDTVCRWTNRLLSFTMRYSIIQAVPGCSISRQTRVHQRIPSAKLMSWIGVPSVKTGHAQGLERDLQDFRNGGRSPTPCTQSIMLSSS